ncbi:MAG: hypothetical protein M3N54_12840 [Acidobacteriota bacterium]|nr:hypothetical protein [Acidobacteriota bacterium]
MTLTVLSILDGITKLAGILIASQTPDQQRILWDRYIQDTAPLHRLLIKLENLGTTPAA